MRGRADSSRKSCYDQTVTTGRQGPRSRRHPARRYLSIPNIRLPLPANRRVRRGLIITLVLTAVWLLGSLAMAYALTRRHGPRAAEAMPEISDWNLETHRLKT